MQKKSKDICSHEERQLNRFSTRTIHQLRLAGPVVSTVVVTLFGIALLVGQYANFKNSFNDIFFQLLILALIAVISIGMVSSFVSVKISKELNALVLAIKNAPEKYECVDEKAFDIEEFAEIAKEVNAMVSQIRQKSSALVELNETLENKVKEKTAVMEKLFASQDKFIKNAIHEINTPLAIIQANIELSAMKEGKSRYLDKIEAASKIITNIYEDMSYFVRKDRLVLKREVINFSDYLLQRLEYFHEIVQGNNISFEKSITPQLFIRFDAAQLQRICDNNIYNAIKYAVEKSFVEISLCADEGKIKLLLTNQSHKPIEEKRIFDRFYRGESARGGFGIGLHLVREICLENGVQFEAKNCGSRVCFSYLFDDFYEDAFGYHGF